MFYFIIKLHKCIISCEIFEKHVNNFENHYMSRYIHDGNRSSFIKQINIIGFSKT